MPFGKPGSVKVSQDTYTKRCSEEERLQLDECTDLAGFLDRAGHFRNPPQLKRIVVNLQCDWNEDWPAKMFPDHALRPGYLAAFQELQSIDVQNCNIDKFELPDLPKLKYFNVSNNRVTTLQGMGHIPTLLQLHARGNELGGWKSDSLRWDDAAAAAAECEALKQLPNLTIVDLEANGGLDVSDICAGLCSLSRLQTLIIRSTSGEHESFKRMTAAFEARPNGAAPVEIICSENWAAPTTAAAAPAPAAMSQAEKDEHTRVELVSQLERERFEKEKAGDARVAEVRADAARHLAVKQDEARQQVEEAAAAAVTEAQKLAARVASEAERKLAELAEQEAAKRAVAAARAQEETKKMHAQLIHAKADQRAAEAQLTAIQQKVGIEPEWQCEVDGGAWVPYDRALSNQIEGGFRKASQVPHEMKFLRAGVTYIMNFDRRTQRRPDTGVERTVRRVDRLPVTPDSTPWLTACTTISPGVRKYSITTADLGSTVCRDMKEFYMASAHFSRLVGRQQTSVHTVDIYESNATAQQFAAAKEAFAHAGKPTEETWIFHGTSLANVVPIMSTGFKIGGQDGHPIVSGASYGQGLYSATGPAAPMGYAQNAGCVILARALPGRQLTGQGCNGGRGTEDYDSWTPSGQPDWLILGTKAQILPCYVVHYR
jgi:hypothetical protein